MRILTLILTSCVLITPMATAADLPGTGEDEGKTVIYRDTWGIPHIYAPTDRAGLYAQGYAMAEDRPEQLLINFLTAIGQISMLAGPSTVDVDLRSHLFDHYGVAKRNWDQIKPEQQQHLLAFRDGMNAYYASHPAQTPPWWQGRQIDEYMLIAFGRLFLYNWSIDEAYGDLKRGGIDPGYTPAQRGSNQFAVSPKRSASGAAILAIDPHLAWFGPSRFWECRIHAGDLHGSGVTLPGSPYIGLGHNRDLAWAMTTGGPDTADIFELTLKEGDNTKYLYDGEYRELTSREVTLQVRGKGEEKHTLWFSHLGPIVAWDDGKAYAGAMAYADVANITEAWHHLNYAKDYKGAEAAMATLTIFPQNVMVADTSGNIYFQRTGRVPRRSMEYDWSKPVDGSVSASAWQGFHPSSDHLQVLNPPQGYMQNCNIPPDAMMPNSPFSIDKQPDYLFSSYDHGTRLSGWTNQRGARAIELLQGDTSVTAQEAIAIINDVRPYGADRWITMIRQAHEQMGAGFADAKGYSEGMADLLAWDGALTKDSTGALKFYYWRAQLLDDYGPDVISMVEGRVDDWYHIVEGRKPNPIDMSDEELGAGLSSFANAMAIMQKRFGTLDVKYGDIFRVGRDDKSWPIGGGGDHNTRTLRSIGFDKVRDDHTRWGRSGQTSTQVVELTKPIQSWIYIPIGESDVKDSPHYTDQAEKLFSNRTLKPSWWLPEDLADHIESRTVLEDAPKG